MGYLAVTDAIAMGPLRRPDRRHDWFGRVTSALSDEQDCGRREQKF